MKFITGDFEGWEWLEKAGLDTKTIPCEKPAHWWKLANDQSLSFAERRKSVFLLFQRHVKVGMTLSELSKVLGKPRWLREEDVSLVDAIGGYIPVEWNFDNCVFGIRVFWEEYPREYLAIYLSFQGPIFSKANHFFYRAIQGEKFPNWDPKILEMGFHGKGLKQSLEEVSGDKIDKSTPIPNDPKPAPSIR